MITLVGTVHDDLRGSERLGKILAYRKPAIVATETTNNRALEEQIGTQSISTSRQYLDRLADIFSKIRPEMGEWTRVYIAALERNHRYEDKTVEAYAMASGVPIIHLGEPGLRKRRVGAARYVTEKYLQQLIATVEAALDDSESLERMRSLSSAEVGPLLDYTIETGINAFYQNPEAVLQETPESLFSEEEIWAEKLRKLPAGKLVMPVVGYLHTVKTSKRRTLYGMLEDLDPQTILLPEADDLAV